MQFYKPSDIRTVQCRIDNITRVGTAFGITSDEESVYIPKHIAERGSVDIGDIVTCYCIDQHLDENKQHEVTARYKAIRLKVEQRLSDILPGFVASDAMADRHQPEPEKPKEVTLDQARAIIGERFKKQRAWTARQLVDEVKSDSKGEILSDEMVARISIWLDRLHTDGIISGCEIRDKKGAPADQYYAPSKDIFIRLVDDYELEDE